MTFKGILDGALLRKSICIALLFAVFVLLLKRTGTVSADLLSQKDTCRDDHYNGIRQLFSIVQQEFIRMGNLF